MTFSPYEAGQYFQELTEDIPKIRERVDIHVRKKVTELREAHNQKDEGTVMNIGIEEAPSYRHTEKGNREYMKMSSRDVNVRLEELAGIPRELPSSLDINTTKEKLDLAFHKMEELDTLFERAKDADLDSVSGRISDAESVVDAIVNALNEAEEAMPSDREVSEALDELQSKRERAEYERFRE